ncbi:NAD(P) transhydrogenase subunit alpha [Levilactobacillus acidifarinae]|uniref:proton-translocating NAD(P)(+) transhydrogenase n=1 Tax=Levilactobacillus acidifarinae DSM 19394 = JCM 15949 TaxID=1423715 RepID=A0A0R1LGM6_9LACO|nr:NAD(P) transhydrogenase subunit alpha [Levilactobacillus acidifarinae]KRK95051.1 NAD(P)(+) transhydrogenase [Levilactobacillus acidifarinae DSM 19394]GEO70786.1 NAD(P) transhydrogenase subunit alpha [Levilactobacillus acidifarinae]
MAITISALKEAPGENRVALSPDVVRKLVKSEYQVLIEKDAGQHAFYQDSAYTDAGAQVVDRNTAIEKASIIATIDQPGADVVDHLQAGQTLLGLLAPLTDLEFVKKLAAKKVNAMAFELLPRTVSRAQTMDVLSSQASVAGYKAALLAADKFTRYFPMMITAAGTAKPTKVLVLGTGVAGLQAIGTTKRLGAMVSGYDIRPASRGEVESLGATFLTTSVSATGEGGYARALTPEETAQQQKELAGFIAENDVIITTAQVPGRRPPLLVTQDSVDQAKPGTVFIDLAASDLGGNVAGSKADDTVVTPNGAQIIAAGDMASQLPASASDMFAKNVQAVINDVTKDGELVFDVDDEVVGELLATYQGEIISSRVRSAMKLPDRHPEKAEDAADEAKPAATDDSSEESKTKGAD